MPAAALTDAELADLVVARAAAVRAGELSDEAAADKAGHWTRIRNASTGVEVELAPKTARALRRPGRDGAAQGLARLTGTTTYEAAKVLQTSERVEKLPEVQAAMRRGELSARQVRDIADAAVLDPATQADLIETAKTSDRQGLNEACRKVKDRVLDVEVRHARVHKDRSLVFYDDPDTGGRFARLFVTREVAAEIEAIVAGFADTEFKAARTEGRREPHAAYMADGLLTGLRRAAGTNDADSKPPRVREVVIVVDRSALLRGHTVEGERCEIRGIGSVPVSVAREFMDDAFLKGVLVDGVDVLQVHHPGRAPTAALKTALDLRWDGKCACGQCTKRFGLQYDHDNQPYAIGGEHSMANTRPRSTPEHRDKTRLIDMPKIRAARKRRHAGPAPPVEDLIALGIGPFDPGGQHHN